MACFLYSIWLLRNDKKFVGKMDVAHVVKKWEDSVKEFSNVVVGGIVSKGSDRSSSRWMPPKDGWLAINVDAAWIDGWSATAMAVRDCWGKALLVASSRIQVTSVTSAELKALHGPCPLLQT